MRMRNAAMEAGARIMDIYRKGFDVSRKSDGTPVTAADREAETIILGHLKPFGLPVLSEEREADCAGKGHDPESLGTRFFIVDPLDGTREFVSRNGQFTVNIALIDHGRPILGVVLEPVTGKLFEGGRTGAFVSRVNGQALAGRTAIATNPKAPLRFVASRSHRHEKLDDLCRSLSGQPPVCVGSSLKFCSLAGGEAQIYPRLSPTCEWDTAAGQAVLEAAGGAVRTLEGKTLTYGQCRAGHLNPFFVAAASDELAGWSIAKIREQAPDIVQQA